MLTMPVEAAPGPPILVVEDDPDIRRLLLTVLGEAGLPVEGAADGLEAVRWLTQRRPAVMLLDMLLPHIGGEEVGRLARERYGDDLPILVVTAMERPQGPARGVGAVVFVKKPFDVEYLVPLVRALLNVAHTLEQGD